MFLRTLRTGQVALVASPQAPPSKAPWHVTRQARPTLLPPQRNAIAFTTSSTTGSSGSAHPFLGRGSSSASFVSLSFFSFLALPAGRLVATVSLAVPALVLSAMQVLHLSVICLL
eukprot:m.290220 g.290220  ORF g.290220 m.290220 type:complete len:115 (-) comp12253_c0_seq1:139-483(-)